MGIPLLLAKLSPPPLPATYVPRERLDRLWGEWTAPRLVLVTAGAGFGKTSFLSARARALGSGCLWYSVDESDADLPSFLAHLARLADPAAAHGHAGSRPARSGSSGQAEFDATSAIGIEPSLDGWSATEVLALLARSLRARGPSSLLVIDDLHVIAGVPESVSFLDRLIRFLPEESTVAFASREPIAFSTAKLRAQGRLAALNADELRLTAGEIAALYRAKFPSAEHAERTFGRIRARTEGWAVGVEIFLQNLENDSGPAIAAALARAASAGAGWFAYFAEEVLRRLDAPTQDFLCRSAILPRLEPELCDRVLGRQDSRAILERLCQRNLFTFGRTSERSEYRYHRLFREFLLRQLARKLPASEIQRLRRRAARAFVRSGAWADALIASVEGGDQRGALRLVERVGDRLLVAGQVKAVERALKRIPSCDLARSAGGCFVLGRLCDERGRWPEAETRYRRALRLSRSSRQRAELRLLIARLQCRWGRHRATLESLRKAKAERGSRHWRLRAEILLLEGVAECELGRFDAAETHMEEAIAVLRRHRHRLGEARTACVLAANVHLMRGNFRLGREAARQALLEFQKRGDRRQASHALCILALLTLADGDARAALEMASEAVRIAAALEYPSVEAYALRTLGAIAIREGDLVAAETHFHRMRAIGERLPEQEFEVLSRLGLAEIAGLRGDRRLARKLARDALARATACESAWQIGQCLLALGDAQAEASAARRCLRRAEAIFRRIGARYDLHRVWLRRLVFGDVAAKQRPRLLAELLAGIARERHDALVREAEPDEGARILTDALRLGIRPEYAASMLASMGARVIAAVKPLLEEPDSRVRERAVETLSLIGGKQASAALRRAASRAGELGQAARRAVADLAAGPAEPLRILALGELVVEAGAHRLTHEDWRSSRALRLFLLLLVHRFRWVPREVILESLWPEAEPEKALNNLRQTIHVLRRTLEPDLPKSLPSHYIRFHNDACRLEPGEKRAYDVERLEAALRQGERCWHAGQRGRAQASLAEAMALYRGDFLAESPYEEFAAAEREHLRDRALWAIERLLELRALAREWEELALLSRRALALDAYRESHYRHLVLANLRLGHRREALAGYHEYEAMMVNEMGLPPSDAMKSLAAQVLALGPRLAKRDAAGKVPPPKM